MKKNKKSKTKEIKVVGLISLGVITATISMGYMVNGVLQIVKEESVVKSSSETIDIKSQIPEEMLNSSDESIKELVKKVEEYPDIVKILKNYDKYPSDLIELAVKKTEPIEFIANYLDYKSEGGEDITLSKGEYKEGEIPLFIQWDERWGYNSYGDEHIAVNGCGPTSLAMVIVGLTGNTDINPAVVSNFSESHGYLASGVGTYWSLMTDGAKQFGVRGVAISKNESSIINTLKNGDPIIATMGPGHFTTQGHFIVLTGIDEDGKIIVNDPDSKVKSKQTWDVEVFLKEAKKMWKFSKLQ